MVFDTAHYLNPAYHYDLELSHKQELLDALKRVVQKLEPDVNAAAEAISEVNLILFLVNP